MVIGNLKIVQYLNSFDAETRHRTRNLGMCPDRESNQQPFALQDSAQPNHTNQGYSFIFKHWYLKYAGSYILSSYLHSEFLNLDVNLKCVKKDIILQILLGIHEKKCLKSASLSLSSHLFSFSK